MQPTFETHVVAIGDLFSGNTSFQLPIFQRAYSWREERAAQLLDDLATGYDRVRDRSATAGPGSYQFLGPIILARSSMSAPQEVIDGQQRLVTLSTILAVIRDLLPDGDFKSALQKRLTRPQDAIRQTPEGPRLLVQEVNRASFERWVYHVGGTRSLPRDGSEQEGGLLAVIHRLKTDLGNPAIDYLQGLARYVLEQTFVIKIQAHTLDDAFLLFRSVNTPGQPLSGLDLVKGELLGTEGPSSRDANRLADAWDHIERGLGRDKLEGYVNTVLRLSNPDYRGTDLKLGLRETLADPVRLTEFRHNLKQFIRSYANLDNAQLDYGPDSSLVNRVVACFKGLPFDDWRPTALLWLTRGPNARASLSFFRALNGLCLGFVILGTVSSKRKKRFEKIEERIKTGSVLSSAASELYLSIAERADIRSRLLNPIPANARFTKALLLRINAEIQDQAIPPYFPTDITIEHVLPQAPNVRSGWVRSFPQAQRRKDLCLSLGNLTILTHEANSAIRNIDFDAKKTAIFGARGNQAFALNQMIASTSRWDEDAIIRRRDQLIDVTDRLFMP